MKIDCISDIHGFYPSLTGGDLLILAGDYTARDTIKEWAEFFSWLKKQKYLKKILVAGNHDNFLYNSYPKNDKEALDLSEVQEFLKYMGEEIDHDFEYLCDSGTEFEGLKIWGSPWTSQFEGINPRCCAFTESFDCDNEYWLNDHWDEIPSDTDILITHSPPYGILDKEIRGTFCGSKSLLEHLERIKCKIHVFGHIHECGGQQLIYKRPGHGIENNTIMINASYVNERYKPVNKPMRIVI